MGGKFNIDSRRSDRMPAQIFSRLCGSATTGLANQRTHQSAKSNEGSVDHPRGVYSGKYDHATCTIHHILTRRSRVSVRIPPLLDIVHTL